MISALSLKSRAERSRQGRHLRPRTAAIKRFIAGVMACMIFPASNAFCQSIEDLEARHRASIGTPEGQAYESVAAAEFTRDLDFMPRCARRAGVHSGAVTIYYEITAAGKVGRLYLFPESVLSECIRARLSTREFTPPPGKWLGKLTLTVSR